jgi:hypothetical protein
VLEAMTLINQIMSTHDLALPIVVR